MSIRTLVLAIGVLAGCTRTGVSGSIMTKEKFATVYAGLLEAGQKSKEQAWDPGRTRLAVDSVLVGAGVTRDDYRATVSWLNDDVVRWRGVSEETVKILEEKAAGRDTRTTPVISSH